MNVLRVNRAKGNFLVHEFVVMPEHLHVFLTPAENVSLEKAMQFIKGGYSFRLKRELGYKGLIWQESFSQHRVKDAADYERHREYIRKNPVKRGLVRVAEEYPYSSARGEWDPRPEWLRG